MAFVVRRWWIKLILLILRYAEQLMWSVGFTIDRVEIFDMSRLPTLKWLLCDTLTLLQDPTNSASVLSVFSFSLWPVTHLQTESTYCSTSSISEWKSDGAKNQWKWVSSANLSWLHLLREMFSDCGWMCRIKSNPRLNTEEPYSEASYVKRPNHLCLQPELCQTSRIKMSDKHDENHSRALPNMLNMSYNCACASNAAEKSSKVKTDTLPSSALPRGQFITSRRAVSIL